MNFQQAEFIASYGVFSQIPRKSSLEVAFAGRSNVGKSTLINRVFNQKNLARVSAVPGKTATINFYRLSPLTIVDLPGYGYAKAAKHESDRWSRMITEYLDDDRDICLVFLLLDMRHPPSKLDLMMIDYFIDEQLPFVIVFTKADKLNKSERVARLEAFSHEIDDFDLMHTIVTSAQTREGIEEIRTILEDIADEASNDDVTEMVGE